MTDVDDAIERAESLTLDAALIYANQDRRILAAEVRRLRRLVGLGDPEAVARLEEAMRVVARQVTEEALDDDNLRTWKEDHDAISGA